MNLKFLTEHIFVAFYHTTHKLLSLCSCKESHWKYIPRPSPEPSQLKPNPNPDLNPTALFEVATSQNILTSQKCPHMLSGPRYVACKRTNTHTCTQGLCWPLRWTGDRTTHATQSVYLTTLTVTMVTSDFSLFQFSFPLPSIHTSSHNPHLSSPPFHFPHLLFFGLFIFFLKGTFFVSPPPNSLRVIW